MPGYRSDRVWSDQFIPAIKNIVGPLLLTPADVVRDTREVTDLIILKATDMRIAARIRSNGYANSFPYDFTIRYRRDSGTKTEYAKIMEGWGDWFFYGHEKGPASIEKWMIVDLHVLRSELTRIREFPIKFAVMPNNDGTSFLAFDVRSFQGTRKPILVADNLNLKQEAA